MVHGDLTPNNIIFINNQPYIIDFSLCGAVGSKCPVAKGTFGYSFIGPSTFVFENDLCSMVLCVSKFVSKSAIFFEALVKSYENFKNVSLIDFNDFLSTLLEIVIV